MGVVYVSKDNYSSRSPWPWSRLTLRGSGYAYFLGPWLSTCQAATTIEIVRNGSKLTYQFARGSVKHYVTSIRSVVEFNLLFCTVLADSSAQWDFPSFERSHLSSCIMRICRVICIEI